jgi:hypothetical protein
MLARGVFRSCRRRHTEHRVSCVLFRMSCSKWTLSAEIAGKEILIAPNSPSAGVTVAFIVGNGAPVEFLQFDNK